VLAHALIGINPQYPEVSGKQREQLLIIKGELEAQAPTGAPADPFAAKEAKEAKARARKNAKANAEADGGMKSPSRTAAGRP
jgi:hypothetical protein